MTPNPREAEILKAIAAGRNMDELLSFGPWTVNDVTQTMRKFGLVADENGEILKVNRGDDYLLAVALRSTSQHVRTKALRAQALLVDIRRHLAVAEAERADEAARERARQEIYRWQEWLKEAQVDARKELRRLNPHSRRKGAA